jgi:hypothetical protein
MHKFSEWIPWLDRHSFEKRILPGVYILANIPEPKVGRAIPVDEIVVYIGETSRTLEDRWNNFHAAAFENGNNHSGGLTYKSIFPNKNGSDLYVAAFPVADFLNLELLPFFIRYTERKLIWKYILQNGDKPICNLR